MDKHHIYILKSLKDGKNYTGCTRNIERRLYEHSHGMVKSTRSRRPLKLIYSEVFETKDTAQKRERFLKSGQGREDLKKILQNPAT